MRDNFRSANLEENKFCDNKDKDLQNVGLHSSSSADLCNLVNTYVSVNYLLQCTGAVLLYHVSVI